MKSDLSKLRGKIVEKYRTQANFAEKLGVVPLTISRKLSGESPFSTTEIYVWCKLLDIPTDEIMQYFFSQESLQPETK